MTYKEEYKDLFTVSNEYFLAHCISADLAMGKGIAVEFNKHFNMRSRLLKQYNTALVTAWDNNPQGHCIKEGNVFNLITKRNYWMKPSYKTIEEAINEMMKICLASGIKKIAMPVIGCGLDRLQWDKVSQIIKDVFDKTDIEILVCKNR